MSNEKPQVRERRVIRISKTKFTILVIIVVVVIGVAWFMNVASRGLGGMMYSNSFNSPRIDSQSQSINSIPSISMMRPEYYNNNNGDITDTREFMKTSYSATIQTRDVSKVVNDVKNIVKGADGRVDNIQSGEKYGSITFVVPKTNFDSFRDQVEALTHRKLYTENISSQNLLTTKQSIEERTTSVEVSLASLNTQRTALEKRHTETMGGYNTELSRIQAQISVIGTSIANVSSSPDSRAIIASLQSQEEVLLSQEAAMRQKISSENISYSSKKQSLDSQIANQNSNLASVKQDDTNFGNNIETVSGSVSANWVSMWQLACIYSPISPVWIIIILIILIWMYLGHKRYVPKGSSTINFLRYAILYA